MKGIRDRVKRYVCVTVRVDEEGRPRILEIQLHGRTYVVDEVLRVQRRSARRTGGDGICYTVRIGDRTANVYYEDPRWFVEEIVCDEGC